MILILAGIPGSGKSTLLNALQEQFPAIDVINYGEIMLQVATHQGLTRDALRKLPLDKQQDVGLTAAHKIAENCHRLTIVDTHACVKTPVGYCPGVPAKVLAALNPKGIILVQSSPSTIVSRRHTDDSRNRDQESLHELALHQELTRGYLVAASALTGAVLCVVDNDNANIVENLQPLVKLIESMV